MRKLCLLLCACFVLSLSFYAQTTVKKVVLQAFWWDYYNANYPDKWANYLTELAPRLKAMGIDAVWIPPSIKNESPYYVGYSPFDQYDLGDKFQKNSTATRLGTKDELLRMIAVMHANGIEVIQDVVLNHTASAGSANGSGGYDPNSFSVQNSGGYKNFRYVCYASPASAETQTNYWNRRGRWPKNYTNFYPNPSNNCTTGDICSAFFGPDMSYESSAFGISSNVVGHNPAQSSNYMRNEGRNWMMWMKKQTGVDGFRWDAVKHFPTSVQEDYSFNVKYSLPTWAKGDRAMFNVGEWVGGKNELDAYVNAIAAPSGEKMMGAFDFGLRAFDGAGGLYGMVYGMGNFNMASLPAAQQNERVAFYSANNTYVHRTVPFVNNHDTFRPQLSSVGNYIGWNNGSELSPHIVPTEPRMNSAYAVIMAMDGNPQIFFEDLFDIGSQGNRFNHDPKSITSLPARGDLINLLWCHQNLDFKSGAYQVPFSSADYLVIARAGRAIIGITDSWSTWQNQWVNTGFAPGTVLKDYSGANGTSTVTVNADGWAPINTPPVNPALNTAGRHGYSVWAPVGKDASTYTPPRGTATTQEWEMANDLGDSHVNSLGQGGALPANSTNFRVAGKIFVESGKAVNYILYPELTNRSLFVGLYNNAGALLSSRTGTGTLTGAYTPTFTGWITVRVRNNVSTNPTQKCWINVTYTAPAIITNANLASANNTSAMWTGNAASSDWMDARNWEEGMIPNDTSVVVVPGGVFPQPAITQQASIAELIVEEGASVFVNAHLSISNQLISEGTLQGVGSYSVGTNEAIPLTNTTQAELFVFPNPSEEEPIAIGVNGSLEGVLVELRILSADGKLVSSLQGNIQQLNNELFELSGAVAKGVYFIQCTFEEQAHTLKWVKQ